MSIKLPTTISKSSVYSHNLYSSNVTQINKVKLFTSTTRRSRQTLVHKSNFSSSKQTRTEKEKKEDDDDNHNEIINRRNVLLGLGTLYSTATIFINQDLISIAAHQHSETPPLISKLGPKPLILEKKTIRVLVHRPKKLRTRSKKGNSAVEVLIVDGIEIHHNGPIRFDVYVAKAHNDVVGPELGEFAGSLVNLPFPRVGEKGGEKEIQGKGSLELGINGLVREIEAQNCEKLAVSLVPRLGEVMIGGIRIEGCTKNYATDIDEVGAPATLRPHRTATFAMLPNSELHLLN